MEVKVNVDPEGKMTVETSGYKGDTCLKELEDITEKMKEFGIGSTVKDQKKKSEYYAAGTSTGIIGRSH